MRFSCFPSRCGDVFTRPSCRPYRGTVVDLRISCCGTRRNDDVVRNVVISATTTQRMSHPRTAARWTAPRIITLVPPMVVVCTSVLYVDCAPIRAPIILPTRSERHCRLARDRRRRRWGQTGRARSTRASGRGLRPRRTPRSHRGWFRAEVRGPGLRG